ncbi:uncharacterized protein LOC132585695 [Heteronotia binoei]|uniref:uncharacterized protein LOC132585695 n=1 Tax=Heteronotia binoei TaxID=13085 RepID=UPI00292F92B8|nr:uncharacterized protein LOC132585695 [Heteronotia binoei]
MKSLAVFLTLAILAGSQAAPITSLQQVDKVLWEYFPSIYNTTQEHLDALRNSQQGQEISNLVLNAINTMKSSQAELVAEIQKLGGKLSENMPPRAKELKEKVEILLAEWQEKVVAALNTAQEGLMEHTEPLRQTLTNLTDELGQKVEQSTEQLLGTSSEALKAKFRKQIQEVHQKLQQKVQAHFRPWKPKLQQLTRKLYSYAESVQNDLLNSFRNIANMWSQMFQ